MLNSLNPQQLKAVTYNTGSMLVLAGAGSGKTRVLTTRINWLVQHHNVDISRFLAVTFTTKAAKEMLHRVANTLAHNPRSMWIGTFHSTALRILSQHTTAAGLKSTFQVLDAQDQLNIVKRILKQENLADDYSAKEIVHFINHNKEMCLRAKNVQATNLRQQLHLDLYNKYESFCNQHYLLDFAELLLRSYELLATNSDILNHYHNQFQHIMVDEFQDTNQLQYKLIKLLSGKSTNVFVVGDDDQSIYSFRGARALNMQDFLRDFKVNEPICLEQNYRSTPTILAAANAIIDNNTQRIGKTLWTNNAVGDKLQLYEGYTEEDEAYFVTDEIKQLASRDGISLSQIAILYRSNAQSRIFEQLFYVHKINYHVYGGLRFFDRQEIKHVLAYLKLLINEHDDTALLRIINVPPRGIGMRTVTQIQESAATNKTSLWTALTALTGKSKVATTKFTKLILDMQIHQQQKTIGEIIQYIVQVTGLEQMYQNDPTSGSERLENLNELVNAVTNFKSTNDSPNIIADFLSYAALESIDHQTQGIETAAVQLMTVHAAKGLEFKIVFVVGLEDGLFPHENSLSNPQDIEEERRLMYVAITRARLKVYLLRAYSRMMWGKRFSAPLSRFINEIPAELINNISGINNIQTSDNKLMASENQLLTQPICNPETKISRIKLGDTNDIIKIGDTIFHAKFGNGRIISLNIDGNKKTGTIFFIGLGQKVLDLNIAKLEKVPS